MSEYPYPGLRPFRPDESDIFFGREEQTDQLLERLGNSHFIAIIGTSGCGKSSLMHTGMVAGLQMGLLVHAGIRWRIAEFRPSNIPLERFTAALLEPDVLGEAYASDFSSQEEAGAFLRASLGRGPRALCELLDRGMLPNSNNLLVIVDQFEELFYFPPQSQEEREEVEAFVALLLESSQHPQVYVTITMRSDYLGKCAQFYGLPEAVNQGLFLVPRLNREQLLDAIISPARVFGGDVEPGIANRLLNDAGNREDQLPLIQHCLMWMWRKALDDGRDPVILNKDYYWEVRGLGGALSLHADKAYKEELSEPQQMVAGVLFRALTSWEDEERQVRRPSRLDHVAGLAGVSWEQVRDVVEVFRKPGRSFLTPDEATVKDLAADTMIDISHESLIRQWKQLREWAKDEAELGWDYQRLEERAQEWEKGKASPLQSLDLKNALAWEKKARPTVLWAERYGKNFDLVMKFLKKSRLKAIIKRLSWFAIGIVIFLVLSTSVVLKIVHLKLDILQREGFHHLELGNLEKAEDTFKSATRLAYVPKIEWKNVFPVLKWPHSPELFNGLGQVYEYRLYTSENEKERQKNAKKSEDAYKRAIDIAEKQKHEKTPKYLISFAKFYLSQGQYDKVDKIVGKVLNDSKSEDADIGRAYLLKGDVFARKNRYEKAAEAYEEAKNIYKPEEPKEAAEWYFELANSYFKIKNFDRAMENCNHIIKKEKLKPLLQKLDNIEKLSIHAIMGASYYWKKDYNNAKQSYKKAIDIYLNDPQPLQPLAQAYQSLGDTYAILKDHNNAIQNYKKAIEFYPSNPQTRQPLAQAYQSLGNIYTILDEHDNAIQSYHNAIQFYKEVIDLYPNNPQARQLLAKAHQSLGNIHTTLKNYNLAIKSYHDALKSFESNDPQKAFVFLSLVSVYLNRNERDKACNNFYMAKDIAATNQTLMINFQDYLNKVNISDKDCEGIQTTE